MTSRKTKVERISTKKITVKTEFAENKKQIHRKKLKQVIENS